MVTDKTIFIPDIHARKGYMANLNPTTYAFYIFVVTNCVKVATQTTELFYTIAEESPVMTFVGNILEDSNIKNLVSPREVLDLRFTFLTERNQQTTYLWINATSGELTTFSRINRETICQKLTTCELRVQTVIQAQLGAFFKIIQVKVTVTDINDNAPTFSPSIYNLRIAESVTLRTSFRIPTAADLDFGTENGVTEYNSEEVLFPFHLIVDRNGSNVDVSIRLDAILDREKTASYTLCIRAVDGGIPRLTGTLTVNIEVIDVNDNSPVFQKEEYIVTVSDSARVASAVIVLQATDIDEGDNGLVVYHISSVQEDNSVFDMFDINGSTGEVRTKVSLDRYAGRSYRLLVEAHDSGSAHKTARTGVVISVLDTHNSHPEILLNVFGTGRLAEVSELAELGRAVAHVAVSDPDSILSDNGKVACSLNKMEHFQLQAIDAKQFKVILIKRLDTEQQTFHNVTIFCEDSGTPPLNASSSFTVEVKDENDNAPEFDSLFYTIDVTEGKHNSSGDNNHAILRVYASDRDTGLNAQLTYHLAHGADSDLGLYADGSIVVSNPAGLDREDKAKGSVRNMVILAVDNGKFQLTGTTTVTVNIKDINDNPPVFSEPVYFFNVAEDASVGHIVNNVSATDADLEINSTFFFTMPTRFVNRIPFTVSPEGIVTISGSIDRESTPSYQFYIVAYDHGEPQQSSIVPVKINIMDINDNSPKFMFPSDDNYTISIPHTLPVYTSLVSVISSDLDQGRNGQLVYMIDRDNGSIYFDIESDTGQIILAHSLTKMEIGLHILIVIVHDQGMDLQLETKSILHILVYEGNATISLQDAGHGFRNVVAAAALVVVTAICSLTIFITIILIRCIDKQRWFYSYKGKETKMDTKQKHSNPYLSYDPDSVRSISEITAITGNEESDRKLVSFLTSEDRSSNSCSVMTNAVSAQHEENDHLSEILKEKLGVNESVSDNNDNCSDTAETLRTGDCLVGNNNVDGQSNMDMSGGTDDISIVSKYHLKPHNNLSLASNGIIISCRNSRNIAKSVHFQNIRLDSTLNKMPVSLNTSTSLWPCSLRSSIRSVLPVHNNGFNVPRPKNIYTESGSYDLVTNSNSMRHSGLPNQELEFKHNKLFREDLLSNQNSRHTSFNNINRGHMNIPDNRSSNIPNMSNSILFHDEAETLDVDTTTSGSYTVDPHELCDEIDTLFFGNNRDIVV